MRQETTGFVDAVAISWTTCKQSSPHFRQITTTPHHSIFKGRMLFLMPNQQCSKLPIKKQPRWLLVITYANVDWFSNSFTDRFLSKLSVYLWQKLTPHVHYDALLLCEIWDRYSEYWHFLFFRLCTTCWNTAVSCSLAVLDPRVGHTMDVLSPFISVLCVLNKTDTDTKNSAKCIHTMI